MGDVRQSHLMASSLIQGLGLQSAEWLARVVPAVRTSDIKIHRVPLTSKYHSQRGSLWNGEERMVP